MFICQCVQLWERRGRANPGATRRKEFFRGTGLLTVVHKNQTLVPRSNFGGTVCARTKPWLPVPGQRGGGVRSFRGAVTSYNALIPPPLVVPHPGKTVPHHPLGDGHQVTVPHPPLGDRTTTVHAGRRGSTWQWLSVCTACGKTERCQYHRVGQVSIDTSSCSYHQQHRRRRTVRSWCRLATIEYPRSRAFERR